MAKASPFHGALYSVLDSVTKIGALGGDISTIRLTFQDTGIGMSKEFIPHIFDAFSQEDSSSTNRYGSTGLGMPITKSIVELMNGHIDVESEKGVIKITEGERLKVSQERLSKYLQIEDKCFSRIQSDIKGKGYLLKRHLRIGRYEYDAEQDTPHCNNCF
jgi:signal transduction histidine kinase